MHLQTFTYIYKSWEKESAPSVINYLFLFISPYNSVSLTNIYKPAHKLNKKNNTNLKNPSNTLSTSTIIERIISCLKKCWSSQVRETFTLEVSIRSSCPKVYSNTPVTIRVCVQDTSGRVDTSCSSQSVLLCIDTLFLKAVL